jgi:hypothetical protein
MFLGRTSNDVRPFTFLPQKRKNRRKKTLNATNFTAIPPICRKFRRLSQQKK